MNKVTEVDPVSSGASETLSEINFDGLVGPTHAFAGLAVGNLAADANAGQVSNPRAAAQQGLDKMRVLIDLGLDQGVLPPHERPAVPMLRSLGFAGSDHDVIRSAHRDAPELFQAMCSASAMWVANAATVSSSLDTADNRIHMTTANLASQLHRSIEATTTGRLLAATFPDAEHVVHHDPLPSVRELGDEGAANHTRLASAEGGAGASLFVYGIEALRPGRSAPTRYPARQTLEASAGVARQHRLDPSMVVLAQQSPDAIDAGVFHNDVIAVGHRNVLFHHELAFADTAAVIGRLEELIPDLVRIEVASAAVPIADAISSYVFNSQLVSLPDGRIALVCPSECQSVASVSAWLDSRIGSGIDEVIVVDVRQSMRNGGGPACLRLRVPATPAERASINPGSLVDHAQLDRLSAWVDAHYRDELVMADLADPALLDESRRALDELTQLLGLGSVYPFQL